MNTSIHKGIPMLQNKIALLKYTLLLMSIICTAALLTYSYNKNKLDLADVSSENQSTDNASQNFIKSDSSLTTALKSNVNRVPKIERKVPSSIKAKSNIPIEVTGNKSPNEFLADLAEGSIGDEDNTMDSPQDNHFVIPVPIQFDNNDHFMLTYEVFGQANAEGVTKTINFNRSTGGYLLSANNKWTTISELISTSQLKMGKNHIIFTSMGGQHHYKIKNVKIIKLSNSLSVGDIQLASQEIRYEKNGMTFISGTVSDKVEKVIINNTKIEPFKNSIQAKIKIEEQDKKNGYVPINLLLKDGTSKIEFLWIAAHTIEADEINEPKIVALEKNDNHAYLFESVASYDAPPLGSGIVNVTAQKSIYNLEIFKRENKSYQLSIPFDPSLIPAGLTSKDIQVFYYDVDSKNWSTMPIDSIDNIKNEVRITSGGETDYINGVIQAPESPTTSAFTPTMMNDIKVADPAANVNIMSPPSTSQKGDADISYPLNIPTGRNGMQPNLTLTYNSEGGSGWLGQGWNIASPAISIDTRWGTALFDPINESEIYMLNGQQLIYNDRFLPHRHKDTDGANPGLYLVEPKPRVSGNLVFYERKLGSFNKIERIGSGPQSYFWKVTDANGTISLYGSNDGISVSNNHVLKDAQGNVTHWALAKVTNVFGDQMRYLYSSPNFPYNSNTLYLFEIYYGKNDIYKIEFVKATTGQDATGASIPRKDVVVNGRLGLRQEDKYLLNQINISSQGTLFRNYKFNYKEGAFFKTLLTGIREYGEDGNTLFYEHKFDYYNDIADCGTIFDANVTVVELPCDPNPCIGPDTDGDGIPNACDNCPNVPNPLQDNACNEACGVVDTDADGIFNNCDNCPYISNPSQDDDDDDGVGNVCDNCNFISNANQADSDNDGIGDACDLCPQNANPNEVDSDGDGVGNTCDNCPSIANSNQIDLDGDGLGDACDNCPYKFNPNQSNQDGDGQGDLCDPCPYDPINACACYQVMFPLYSGDILYQINTESGIFLFGTYNLNIPAEVVLFENAIEAHYGINIDISIVSQNVYITIPNSPFPFFTVIINQELNYSFGECDDPLASGLGSQRAQSNRVNQVIQPVKLEPITLSSFDKKEKGHTLRSMESMVGPCPNGIMIDIGIFPPISITNDNYFRRNSALGTNHSYSNSAGIGLGFGIGTNLLRRGAKVTIDGDFGVSSSISTSQIAMMDIDGDGYSDIVWQDGNTVKYSKHIVNRTLVNGQESIEHIFEDEKIAVDLPMTYAGSSEGFNFDFGFSAGNNLGVNISKGISKNKSYSPIYVTDANGDQMPDVSIYGKALFNRIENGSPKFEPSSELTENLIIKSSSLEVTEPSFQSINEEDEFPSMANDVVKVWEAPADGLIYIDNVDDITSGVKISIETDNNGFYGYDPNGYNPMTTATGTCRLFANDNTAIPAYINALPNPNASFGLKCTANTAAVDPCEIDSDGDGVNDCVDCDGGLGCPCQDVINISNNMGQSLFQAGSTINSTANEIINGPLHYYAGDQIFLDDLFETKNVNPFLASIQPCSNMQMDPDPGFASTLRVKKGQRIYFRLHRNPSTDNPEISWNPEIKYKSVSGQYINPDKVDMNGYKPYKSNYANSFVLNDINKHLLPYSAGAEVTISYEPFDVSNLSDDVTLKIKVIKTPTINDDDPEIIDFEHTLPLVTGQTNVISGYSHQFTILPDFTYELVCELVSVSNVDWQSIGWLPKVEATDVAQDPDYDDVAYPVINYSLYRVYTGEFNQNNGPKWPGYKSILADFIENGINCSIKPQNLSAFYPLDDCTEPEWCEDGKLTMVVKQNKKIIGKREYIVNQNNVSLPNSSSIFFTITNDASKELTIDFISDGKAITDRLLSKMDLASNYNHTVAKIFNSGVSYNLTRRNCNLLHESTDLFGSMYMSWGQFMYNENNDKTSYIGDNFGKLINIKKKYPTLTQLQLDIINGLETDQITLSDDENVIDEFLSGTNSIFQNSTLPSLNEIIFIFARPLNHIIQVGNNTDIKQKYRGTSIQNFAAKTTGRTLSDKEALITQIGHQIPGDYVAASDYGACTTKNKVTFGRDESITFGASLGLSLSNSKTLSSESFNLADYYDVNGDRYPDIIMNNNVQYTNKTGGLFCASINPCASTLGGGDLGTGELGKYLANSDGITASGNIPVASGRSDGDGKGNKKDSKFGEANKSISPSVSVIDGGSETDYMWFDINGDGLTDKLDENTNALDIALNLGKGINHLSPIESNWGNVHLSKDSNHSTGLGGGFSSGQDHSIGGGLNISWTNTSTISDLMDINGDGLLDYVYLDPPNTLNVRYNKGNSFGTADECTLNIDLKTTSKATSFGGNVSFTVGIPITFGFINFKIPINVSMQPFSKSKNIVKKSIQDFDGDGYPDYIEQMEDGTLHVRHSSIKRTNKLKSVKTPLGAEYTIDYRLSPSTYDMPNSKWVVSSISTEDLKGIVGVEYQDNEAKKVTKYYEFFNGRYDRREREFLGFEIMRSIDRTVHSDVTSAIYRQGIQTFINQSYHLAGASLKSYTLKGDNNFLSFTNGKWQVEEANMSGHLYATSESEYQLRKPNRNDINNWVLENDAISNMLTYDVGGTEGYRATFALTTKSKSSWYDLTNDPLVKEDEMTYDEFGRVISVSHSISGVGQKYITNISYYTPLPNNIISIPKIISVVANGNLMRNREIDAINANGQPLSITVKNDPSPASTTLFEYYPNGNLENVFYPANQNNEVLSYHYVYGNATEKYVIQISNSEGYISFADYDHRYGHLLSTTDVSGNQMQYTYDNFARPLTVRGPKEIASGNSFTIYNEYMPNFHLVISNDKKAYAITKHFDHFINENYIETITFANGYGQAAQVKKDIALWEIREKEEDIAFEHMTISGHVLKDRYGRSTKQYHPLYEEKNYAINIEFNTNLPIPNSNSEYDEMDRPTVSYDEDQHQTNYTYGITGGEAWTRIDVQQSSSANTIKESYKDADGLDTKTVDISTPHGDITTKFDYDGINQLTSYTANYGSSIDQVSYYTYDMGGRKLSYHQPDAGLNVYTYDALGKVISTTNNEGETVSLVYDVLGRQKEINFPAPGPASLNDVRYYYYGPGQGNNSGRLMHISDATGVHQFEYGNMGEVIRQVRKLVAPNTEERTLAFDDSYDSWGRLIKKTYPSGEVLNYSYDFGGHLTSFSSNQVYLSRLAYDHYEMPIFKRYGNNATQQYSYEPTKRRLQNNLVKDGSNNEMLRNEYSYDFLGNITQLTNSADPSNDLGGTYTHTYNYDNLNRLTSAGSTFNNNYSSNELSMTYDAMHRIVSKNQQHILNGSTVDQNTYNRTYEYSNDPSYQPNVLKFLSNNGSPSSNFDYDKKGNTIQEINVVSGENKFFKWDETNRMKIANINNSALHHYIYDASGERTFKGQGNIQLISVNGGPEQLTLNLEPYTTYVSPEMVIDPYGSVSYHYYAGSERIVSRLAGRPKEFAPAYINGTPSEYQDLPAEQLYDIQHYAEQHDWAFQMVPLNLPKEDCTGLTGEALKQCNCNNDPAQCSNILYFYHTDHLGSSTFLSDANGFAYQFLLYLPFGETMVEQSAAAWRTPYKFTAKEQDGLTGLYYFGARYYDASLSIWHGVDPMAGKYQGWSPYNYCLGNPIIMVDPDGRRPIPAPKWVEAIMKSSKYYNFYLALYNSNNSSPRQFYDWANGRSNGFFNVFGASGESIAAGVIATGSSPASISVSFGQYWSGYQIDLQSSFKTYNAKVIGKMEYDIAFSNFDGEGYLVEFDSKIPITWTINYEVKTFASSNSAETLYAWYKSAFQQADDRTSTLSSAVGVLVTDSDAWMKVANDKTYGPKLKELYNKYVDEDNDDGVKLYLIKNLTSSAINQLLGLRKEVKD